MLEAADVQCLLADQRTERAAWKGCQRSTLKRRGGRTSPPELELLARHPDLADELRQFFAKQGRGWTELVRPVAIRRAPQRPPTRNETARPSTHAHQPADALRVQRLRDPARDRPRGDGHRLPGPAAAAQPRSRPEDDPREEGRGEPARSALPDRGRGGGQAGPPQHRAHLRGRRVRGPAVLQHEARRGGSLASRSATLRLPPPGGAARPRRVASRGRKLAHG